VSADGTVYLLDSLNRPVVEVSKQGATKRHKQSNDAWKISFLHYGTHSSLLIKPQGWCNSRPMAGSLHDTGFRQEVCQCSGGDLLLRVRCRVTLVTSMPPSRCLALQGTGYARDSAVTRAQAKPYSIIAALWAAWGAKLPSVACSFADPCMPFRDASSSISPCAVKRITVHGSTGPVHLGDRL